MKLTNLNQSANAIPSIGNMDRPQKQ